MNKSYNGDEVCIQNWMQSWADSVWVAIKRGWANIVRSVGRWKAAGHPKFSLSSIGWQGGQTIISGAMLAHTKYAFFWSSTTAFQEGVIKEIKGFCKSHSNDWERWCYNGSKWWYVIGRNQNKQPPFIADPLQRKENKLWELFKQQKRNTGQVKRRKCKIGMWIYKIYK